MVTIMKKAVSLILGLCLLGGCLSCSSASEDEMLENIRSDYYEQKVVQTGRLNNEGGEISLDDVDVYAFYGSYRGTYVLSFSISAVGGGDAWLALSIFEVDDLEIDFNVEWLPDVWNNNAFYSLEEAYNTGLLTMDDLIKIKDIESELLPYR